MATDVRKTDKAPVNIVVLGPVDHGKTTLTAALTRVGAEGSGKSVKAYDSNEPVPEERIFNSTVAMARTEYKTPMREYHHVDCPTQGDCIKAMLSGKAPVDGVILVWSAADDPKPDNSEELRLASQMGATNIVVFLNKADVVKDAGKLDQARSEVRKLLSKYGFPGNDIPIIPGSARLALEGNPSETGVPSIVKLVDALDSRIPEPARDIDKPFLLSIEDVASTPGRGMVLSGRVERGIVKVLDPAEVIGLRGTQTTTVVAVQQPGKPIDQAQAGANVGVVARGLHREDVDPGQVLAAPGSVAPYTEFKAKVYMLSQDEGGRRTPFVSRYQFQFHFRAAEVTGVVTLPEGISVATPGDTAEIGVMLIYPVAMEKGQCFTIYENQTPVGYGMVLTIAR